MERTQKDLKFIAKQLTIYRSLHHQYPRVTAGKDLARELGATIPINDAWGTPYRYDPSPDGRHYQLASAGKDRRFSLNHGSQGRDQSDDIEIIDGVMKER